MSRLLTRSALALVALSYSAIPSLRAEEAKPAVKVVSASSSANRAITLKGDVKLNAEAPEPVVVGKDGQFRVSEKKDGVARTFDATEGKATYAVNGEAKPLDAEAKEWLRGIVRDMKRTTTTQDGKQVVEIRRVGPGGEAKAKPQIQGLEALDGKLKDLPEVKAALEKAQKEGKPVKVQIIARTAEAGKDVDVKTIDLKGDEPGEKRVRVVVRKGDGGEVKTIDLQGDEKDAKRPHVFIRKSGDGPSVWFAKEAGEAAHHLRALRGRRGPAQGACCEGEAGCGQGHPKGHGAACDHAKPAGDVHGELKALQVELKALQGRIDALLKRLPAEAPKTPAAPKAPEAPKK